MDGLSVAASVIIVIELSAKITALCLQYSTAVKDAKKDIQRLQTQVNNVEKVVKGVQQLLDGPHGTKLSTSQKLRQAIHGCRAQLQDIETRLDPGKGRKAMSRLGLRALKWPFESKKIDEFTHKLESCNASISLALQVDQTWVPIAQLPLEMILLTLF